MFLTIKNGKLVVINEDKSERVLETNQQVIDALEGEEVFCSSKIDFPEESTEDKWVIEICHALRG